MMKCIIVLFLLVQVFQVYSQTCAVDSSFPSFNPNVYHFQTSDSVKVLRNNIGSVSVTPPVQTPPNAASYLSSSSSLSYNGPIGPYGPLGSLGPLGTNLWNPSTWISGTGWDWSTFSTEISGLGGPLSAAGPLGSTGPLSDTAYYTDMPCINDFSEQLSAGGLWTVLGPLGPMGPAGALGPLGPIGAHGYTRDTNGQYLSNGNVVRSITAPWTSTTSRTWDLFEHYKQSYAALKTDNDCSFFVEGVYGAYGANGDKYSFRSSVAQYVTILLVPLKHLDTWRLTIKNSLGNTIKVVGPDSFYPNWAQIRVPANTLLSVEVQLHTSLHLLASDYRLYVSGSSSYIAPATHIQGPHLLTYTPV